MKNITNTFLGLMFQKNIGSFLGHRRDKQNVVYEQFENNAKSIRRIGLWLKKYNIEWDRVLVCMEFTGIYNRPMLQFCTLKKIAVWMIMPIEIIRSMEFKEGKTIK
ncbi:MAG: hypothetical protein IPH33_12295 [Bacteroidetes bacterium]|nr:hypothetical protein [Bacteroidota bacterium]